MVVGVVVVVGGVGSVVCRNREDPKLEQIILIHSLFFKLCLQQLLHFGTNHNDDTDNNNKDNDEDNGVDDNNDVNYDNDDDDMAQTKNIYSLFLLQKKLISISGSDL